jgi:hypothetical protein
MSFEFAAIFFLCLLGSYQGKYLESISKSPVIRSAARNLLSLDSKADSSAFGLGMTILDILVLQYALIP